MYLCALQRVAGTRDQASCSARSRGSGSETVSLGTSFFRSLLSLPKERIAAAGPRRDSRFLTHPNQVRSGVSPATLDFDMDDTTDNLPDTVDPGALMSVEVLTDGLAALTGE